MHRGGGEKGSVSKICSSSTEKVPLNGLPKPAEHFSDKLPPHLNKAAHLFAAWGQRDANTFADSLRGRFRMTCGSQSGVVKKGARKRRIAPTRRVASLSRAESPFHIPQTFSHVTKPSPLKKACCRSVV
jgi:hypothetical protein